MGNILIYAVLLILIIIKTECSFFRKGARLALNTRYLKNCKTDNDTRQIFSMNHLRYNHSYHALNINWTALEPFDNSYRLHVEMQKWSDGGWKMNFLNIDRNDACKTLELVLGSLWKDALQAAGIKNTNCPIAAGFYKLNSYSGQNEKTSAGIIDSPILVSPGTFYFLFQVIKFRKVSACLEFVLDIAEEFAIK